MSSKDTIVLNPTDLRYLLIDSLKLYSDFSFFIKGSNPYYFSINKKSVYIFIRNTHSSGLGRNNPDECRIQINRTKEFLDALNSDALVFFLGYSDNYGTFTAWNPFLLKQRINKRQTISVYSRFSIQKKANAQGISVYEDDNDQKVISFLPEYLGLYIENYPEMHQSSEKILLDLIKKSDEIEETTNYGETALIEEEKFIVTKEREGRDPRFRRIVYDAYNKRCAFTGIQLDLVEAAHVVPYSNDQGTNDVQNGICLSPLHHKAYDNGLIYIDEDYNIKINEDKVKYLEKVGKDGGLKKFVDLQYDKMLLPQLESRWPSKRNIRLANTIRGIL